MGDKARAGQENPGQEDIMAEGTIGVPEAEGFSGMSRSDLYLRMQSGELPYTKLGRRRLIPLKALKALLSKNLVNAG